MPLSLAEATYEYTQEEIARLEDENEKAKLVIQYNDDRIKYLENKIGSTAERLIEEHPAADRKKAKAEVAKNHPQDKAKKKSTKDDRDVQSEAEQKSLKSPIMNSNAIDGTKTGDAEKTGDTEQETSKKTKSAESPPPEAEQRSLKSKLGLRDSKTAQSTDSKKTKS